MSAVTPPRTRRSKAVTPARTPRTPNKNYAGDPLWAKTFILAAGNEGYQLTSLCQFIEAAAKDGIDLQAMRPKGFSRTERNKLDEAWKRFVKTLRNEGPELKDLLSSAANTLALHNAGELRAHGATLKKYGIRTLRRTDRAQLIQHVITLFFAMTALFLGAKQYWNI